MIMSRTDRGSFCRRPINTSRVEISGRDTRACPRSSFREGAEKRDGGRGGGAAAGGRGEFPAAAALIKYMYM